MHAGEGVAQAQGLAAVGELAQALMQVFHLFGAQGDRVHGRYMDASRLPRTSAVWCWTGVGCSFISGLWCRLDSLLALMGSADPRLISSEGSKPLTPIQAWRVTV
ncbi:MAG: hypothetical protein ACREX4_16765 [Gammaproteobacteria bacterium]